MQSRKTTTNRKKNHYKPVGKPLQNRKTTTNHKKTLQTSRETTTKFGKPLQTTKKHYKPLWVKSENHYTPKTKTIANHKKPLQ